MIGGKEENEYVEGDNDDESNANGCGACGRIRRLHSLLRKLHIVYYFMCRLWLRICI